MNRSLLLLALLPLLVAAQCNTPPSPPPSPGVAGAAPTPPAPDPTEMPDAGPPPPEPDTTPGVRRACEALAAAQCPEGGPLCLRVLQRAVNARITTIPLDCYVAAKTKDDVRRCGAFVACL